MILQLPSVTQVEKGRDLNWCGLGLVFEGPHPVVSGTPGVPTCTVVMVLFKGSFFCCFFFAR